MKFPAFTPIRYEGTVYRNIYTCSPTQDLLDDVCDKEDFQVVDTLVQATSEIDHQAPQVERPFQYGKIEDDEIFAVFKKENWRSGRFGDGQDYGVWYGAEEELTSIYEASWVAYRFGKDNVLNKGEVYTTDRAMYEVKVATDRAMDLTPEKDFFDLLIHPTDYSFCQSLGRRLVNEKFEMLRTSSARRVGGVCAPLFSPAPIQEWKFIYYLRIYLNPDGVIAVNSSKDEMNFSLNVKTLKDPYDSPGPTPK